MISLEIEEVGQYYFLHLLLLSHSSNKTKSPVCPWKEFVHAFGAPAFEPVAQETDLQTSDSNSQPKLNL